MARMQSDRDYRDRIKKHMLTGEPPARPGDYGRQSNRLLGEITEGIRTEDASARGRVRLGLRGQFEQLRGKQEVDEDGVPSERTLGGELGAALIGDMTGGALDVADDLDVFGGATIARALRGIRLRGGSVSPDQMPRVRERSSAIDASLAERTQELEHYRLRLDVERILADYPDMSIDTAIEMAGGLIDEDGPVAA